MQDSRVTAPNPDPEMTSDPDMLSLNGAAKRAGVSVVTLRRYLALGELAGSKKTGRHGVTWAISSSDVDAFARMRFPGRAPVAVPVDGESAVELRRRLDETLLELGKYRALTAKAESANADVERLLKERIGELQAELERLRGRGLWGRLFAR
jgi:DNA-binding transcriptional MerR regulator